DFFAQTRPRHFDRFEFLDHLRVGRCGMEIFIGRQNRSFAVGRGDSQSATPSSDSHPSSAQLLCDIIVGRGSQQPVLLCCPALQAQAGLDNSHSYSLGMDRGFGSAKQRCDHVIRLGAEATYFVFRPWPLFTHVAQESAFSIFFLNGMKAALNEIYLARSISDIANWERAY